MTKIDLLKLPDITLGRIGRARVFSDFMPLAAIKISNGVDPVHYDKRHEHAESVRKAYTDKEQAEMGQYLKCLSDKIVANTKAGNIDDVLGRLFEECGFSRSGQDQTPPDIANLVACLAQGAQLTIPKKGFITLDECACGSGSLILAYAGAMLNSGFNYCDELVVRATDSDLRCVHMAYIQLSLYGIPAVVVHGNTITLEEYSRWYTPLYILRNWVWRSPYSLTGGKSPADEMLKRMTDPLYGGMRRAQELLNS